MKCLLDLELIQTQEVLEELEILKTQMFRSLMSFRLQEIICKFHSLHIKLLGLIHNDLKMWDQKMKKRKILNFSLKSMRWLKKFQESKAYFKTWWIQHKNQQNRVLIDLTECMNRNSSLDLRILRTINSNAETWNQILSQEGFERNSYFESNKK